MARRTTRRRTGTRRGWMSEHPLDGTCVLCPEQLGGGDQRSNPLIKTRKGWAHKACVMRERGE